MNPNKIGLQSEMKKQNNQIVAVDQKSKKEKNKIIQKQQQLDKQVNRVNERVEEVQALLDNDMQTNQDNNKPKNKSKFKRFGHKVKDIFSLKQKKNKNENNSKTQLDLQDDFHLFNCI